MASKPPAASFPIFTTVESFRRWRKEIMTKGETVGFVPTMGALHEGHLSLVHHSLRSTTRTVLSIFVNPTQFAPTEDLDKYPRTLEEDLEKLENCETQDPSSSLPSASTSTNAESQDNLSRCRRRISALFLPTVSEMYPGGVSQAIQEQVGTFVEVSGLQDVMEGKSRKGFFRGVATVVTKLFNIIQPDLAFFGQKDIQQALLLRRLIQDLHLPHPPNPESLIICPTIRIPSSPSSTSVSTETGVALSSRNKYLSEIERPWSNVLWDALKLGENLVSSIPADPNSEGIDVERILGIMEKSVLTVAEEARKAKGELGEERRVEIELVYFAVNDLVSLKDLKGKIRINQGKNEEGRRGLVLSGAVMLGKTRLIDNIVLGVDLNPRREWLP